MDNRDLYWGCAHSQFHARKHLQFEKGFPDSASSWRDFVDRAFRYASGHLDFFPCIYYPAYTYRLKGGISNESVGMRDEYVGEWNTIVDLVEQHHNPGSLVTFPGYEWTGDRRRWGDHNIIYFDPMDAPLDLPNDIETLYEGLRSHRGFAIPHHTGYVVGNRGKDWDHFDGLLSPVAEIYSVHGSSEGVGTPGDMRCNIVMGPRVSGGTVQDGLARGHRFGIIASGDNDSGFPGRWGTGLTGVWADELTREGIWNAISERRTYGVTGDRIKLAFNAGNRPMGSEIRIRDTVEFSGTVVGSDAIDRIELLRDGKVVATYCHRGSWEHLGKDSTESKMRFEFGWGPQPNRGFDVGDRNWIGSLEVEGGGIVSVEGCFTRGPQTIDTGRTACSWNLTTSPAIGAATGCSQQAIVFEFAGRPEIILRLSETGESRETVRVPWREAITTSRVYPDLIGSKRMLGMALGSGDLENAEMRAYGASYKMLRSRAIPREAYDVEFSFTDMPDLGDSYYYIRITQDNGQMAWSSPIWVSRD